jgi:hypothetical protein
MGNPNGREIAMTQKRPSLARQLDLSAAAAHPKVKAVKKPEGTLTARQIKTYLKAVEAYERWLARLLRAATEVQKHRATIRRFKGSE